MIDEHKTGLIFDPSADGDLENRIEQFANDRHLSDRMSDACLTAAGEFDLAKTTDEFIRVYDRISAKDSKERDF
jgi:glycosyltransferase involved in cell wall biosynthesis